MLRGSGLMDASVGIIFLLLSCAHSACCSRQVAITEFSKGTSMFSDVSVIQLNSHQREQEAENGAFKDVVVTESACELCEKFFVQALDYLSENKTQTEIMGILRSACSHLLSFQQECLTMVDYYAYAFFLEILSAQPKVFCQKLNLCHEMADIILPVQEDTCDVCHQVVLEVIAKLQDKKIQKMIIKLLKGHCNSMDAYSNMCKRLVLKYGHQIILYVVNFLQTTDVCSKLPVCVTMSNDTWP